MAYYYFQNNWIEEVVLRVGEKLIYGKKFDLNGKLVTSRLPIKVHKTKKNAKHIEIELMYSMCEECIYGVRIGTLNQEKNFVENEIVVKISKTKKIQVPIEELGNRKIKLEGLFYELDSINNVRGFSPFTIDF